MKYRIKKVTYRDGTSVYYPEFRYSFIWTACILVRGRVNGYRTEELARGALAGWRGRIKPKTEYIEVR